MLSDFKTTKIRKFFKKVLLNSQSKKWDLLNGLRRRKEAYDFISKIKSLHVNNNTFNGSNKIANSWNMASHW